MKKIAGITVLGLLVIVLALFSAASAQQEAQFSGTINVEGHVKTDYPDMSGISLDQALVAAMTFMPGKLLGCELEAENGWLIYSVEMVNADNRIVEIAVDAGNGQVLAVDFDSENDKDEEYQEGHQDRGQHED